MILRFHAALRAALTDTLLRLYALEPAAIPSIVLETPPTRAMGDLACPVAFELARRLRKAPRAIAAEIVAALGPIPGITKAEAAPNGYVNVFLDRAAVIRLALGAADDDAPASAPLLPPEKTIVEHTAINPNKAAHIGHLRNTTLGDTLVRLLRHGGVPVEVQNYIDDTGVQVGDVVVGFQHLEKKTLAEVRAIADSTRFDYYCWDLYARVTEWYDADRSRLKVRSETLHAIEHGGNDTAALGAFIADRIVRCHLKTMARLNVDYDLLTWEGDILRLKFWATAFDLLRESGTMFKQTEGKLAGCWVMPIEEDPTAAPPLGEAAEGEGESEEQREKVIVRSDGTVTYVGKDIAYQYWKLGLLGKDFNYRPFETRLAGDTLWATTTTPGEDRPDRPAFGRAHAVYNVIDTRQSYLQKLLKQALATLGHREEADRSTHFSYEMVALSHRTARELGYTGQDESKPFVEVSGRKGLGVKADDLLDRMIAKAKVEVEARNPDMPADQALRHGHDARRVGGALLPGEVHAHQDDRLRHGRRPCLRGRERPVSAVLDGAGPEHLRQAGRPRRCVGGRPGGEARLDADRRPRARRRRRCAVGAGPRGGAARRDGRPGRADAGAGGAGQVRLRPRPGVQRRLPPLPHPQRGTRAAPPVARRRDQRLPAPAHRRARADGHRRARAHVTEGM